MFAGEMSHEKHSTIASRWISLLCLFYVESFSWVGWGGSHFCSLSQRVRVCQSHTRCHTRAQWASGAAGEEGEVFLGCPLFLNYILDPV